MSTTAAEPLSRQQARLLGTSRLHRGWRTEHFLAIDRLWRAVAAGDVSETLALDMLTKHGPRVAFQRLAALGIDIHGPKYARTTPALPDAGN